MLFFSSEDIFYYLPLRQLLIFLGAHGKGRQKKLPQRGTGTAVLPSETERIFCSLSGGTENGSEFTGLTSGFAFIIILLFNIVSQ